MDCKDYVFSGSDKVKSTRLYTLIIFSQILLLSLPQCELKDVSNELVIETKVLNFSWKLIFFCKIKLGLLPFSFQKYLNSNTHTQHTNTHTHKHTHTHTHTHTDIYIYIYMCIYKSLMEDILSSFIQYQDFQLFVILPMLIEFKPFN